MELPPHRCDSVARDTNLPKHDTFDPAFVLFAFDEVIPYGELHDVVHPQLRET